VPEPTCPTCRRPAARRPANPAFPFCSPRCQLLDLGRWLDAEYRIPGDRAGDGGAAGPPPEEEP